jgi:predicted RNA polymerase sigma factor
LLAQAGGRHEAREAYAMAIGLERDASVRRWLQQRLAALGSRGARKSEI